MADVDLFPKVCEKYLTSLAWLDGELMWSIADDPNTGITCTDIRIIEKSTTICKTVSFLWEDMYTYRSTVINPASIFLGEMRLGMKEYA